MNGSTSCARPCAILERELRERRDAAASYAALGRHDEARALQQQVEVLETLRG